MNQITPTQFVASRADLTAACVAKVSVLMITYNHERFVGQAIESVLSQNVSFRIELVIGEDCSTDGTRKICETYAAAHPEQIRLLPSVRNLGLLANYMRTWEACGGEYLAAFDGDDFWLSPDKLAQQVACLESNPRLSMCYHNARLADEQGTLAGEILDSSSIAAETSFEDFMAGEFFLPTTSVMFRGALFRQLPGWMADLPFEDWPTHVLHMIRGPVAYIPQTMSAYRIHPHGIWSGLDRVRQAKQSYTVRRAVCRHLNIRFNRVQNAILCELARRVAREQALAGRPAGMSGWLARSWGHRLFAAGARSSVSRWRLWGPIFKSLPHCLEKFAAANVPSILASYRALKHRLRRKRDYESA